MLKPYPIKIFFDNRDKLWVAVSDDLPGCSAGGSTPQEALAEFELAVEAWLEARVAAGLDIPEPTLQLPKKGLLQILKLSFKEA